MYGAGFTFVGITRTQRAQVSPLSSNVRENGPLEANFKTMLSTIVLIKNSENISHYPTRNPYYAMSRLVSIG